MRPNLMSDKLTGQPQDFGTARRGRVQIRQQHDRADEIHLLHLSMIALTDHQKLSQLFGAPPNL